MSHLPRIKAKSVIIFTCTCKFCGKEWQAIGANAVRLYCDKECMLGAQRLRQASKKTITFDQP